MVTIVFTTGNAAFRDEDENLCLEAVAITLQTIVEQIKNGRTNGAIIDYNGNRVGEFKIDEN